MHPEKRDSRVVTPAPMRRGILTWIARGSALAIASVIAACSAADETDVGSEGSAIYGGTLSGTDDDAVVFIETATSPGLLGLCTGSLVAPNLVLTARHCVSREASEGVACNQDGVSQNGEHVSTDYEPSAFTIKVGATTKVAVAKAKQVVHPDTKYLCDADIAFLVLDRPVVGIKPLKVRYKTPTTTADVITSIGYGRNNTGTEMSTRLKRNDVKVLATGPNTSTLGTAVSGREFEVTQSICSGDSGGPAINMKTGAVIGVVSRGGDCNNDYGQIYTMPYNFPVTFGNAMTAAGATIVDESDGTNGGADAGAPDSGSTDAGADSGPRADGGVDAGDGGRSDGGDAGDDSSKGPIKKKKTPKAQAPEGSEEEATTTTPKKQGCTLPQSSVASDRSNVFSGISSVGGAMLGLALLGRRRRHGAKK